MSSVSIREPSRRRFPTRWINWFRHEAVDDCPRKKKHMKRFKFLFFLTTTFSDHVVFSIDLFASAWCRHFFSRRCVFFPFCSLTFISFRFVYYIFSKTDHRDLKTVIFYLIKYYLYPFLNCILLRKNACSGVFVYVWLLSWCAVFAS